MKNKKQQKVPKESVIKTNEKIIKFKYQKTH